MDTHLYIELEGNDDNLDYSNGSSLLPEISKTILMSVNDHIQQYNESISPKKGYNIFIKLNDIEQIGIYGTIDQLQGKFIENAIKKAKFDFSIKIEKIKNTFTESTYNIDKEKHNLIKTKNFNNQHGVYNLLINIMSIRDTMTIDRYIENIIISLCEIPVQSTIKKSLVNHTAKKITDVVRWLKDNKKIEIQPNFDLISNQLDDDILKHIINLGAKS